MYTRLGVNQDRWFIEISMTVDGVSTLKILEYWSAGVLECWVKEAKNDMIFSFPLVSPRFKHGSYFPIIALCFTACPIIHAVRCNAP